MGHNGKQRKHNGTTVCICFSLLRKNCFENSLFQFFFTNRDYIEDFHQSIGEKFALHDISPEM